MKMVKVSIDYNIIKDMKCKFLLSAWNRKYQVMGSLPGCKISKFYLDADARLNCRSGHLIANVVYDENVTDEQKILDHFNRFRNHMLPKFNRPDRNKYRVGDKFVVFSSSEDITDDMIPTHLMKKSHV